MIFHPIRITESTVITIKDTQNALIPLLYRTCRHILTMHDYTWSHNRSQIVTNRYSPLRLLSLRDVSISDLQPLLQSPHPHPHHLSFTFDVTIPAVRTQLYRSQGPSPYLSPWDGTSSRYLSPYCSSLLSL